MASTFSCLLILLFGLCLVLPSSCRLLRDAAAPPSTKAFICGTYNISEVHHHNHHHHHLVRGDGRRLLYNIIRSSFFRQRGSESKVVTYALQPDSSYHQLGREEILATLRKACGRWQAVTPLRFQEASDYMDADVKVGFYKGEHGDRNPFDGPGGIVAHASTLGGHTEGAELHLDAEENWTTDLGKHKDKEDMLDLESVLVHELGHVLGLDHSTLEGAVMYPVISMGKKKVEFDADDIEGMKELFGMN